jgi:hypothetical protein
MTTLGERVAQRLVDELEELEALVATGAASQETHAQLEAVRSLLALRESCRPAAPKNYGNACPTVANFDRQADKWGNA